MGSGSPSPRQPRHAARVAAYLHDAPSPVRPACMRSAFIFFRLDLRCSSCAAALARLRACVASSATSHLRLACRSFTNSCFNNNRPGFIDWHWRAGGVIVDVDVRPDPHLLGALGSTGTTVVDCPATLHCHACRSRLPPY
jgi:hypothetical protein